MVRNSFNLFLSCSFSSLWQIVLLGIIISSGTWHPWPSFRSRWKIQTVLAFKVTIKKISCSNIFKPKISKYNHEPRTMLNLLWMKWYLDIPCGGLSPLTELQYLYNIIDCLDVLCPCLFSILCRYIESVLNICLTIYSPNITM